jgi:DNA-binding beta-propeller fold protein YncE
MGPPNTHPHEDWVQTIVPVGRGSGELTIYDAATHKEVKRLNTGHGAAGILMDPDGSRAFVACSADNYIVVVDLKKLEITGHIDVGGVPDGLAWAVR